MFPYDNREVKATRLCCRSVGMPVRNTQPCPPGQVYAFLGILRKPYTLSTWALFITSNHLQIDLQISRAKSQPEVEKGIRNFLENLINMYNKMNSSHFQLGPRI